METMDITEFLYLAIEKNASDLLMSASARPALRIKGELIYLDTPPLDASTSKTLIYSLLYDEQIARFEQSKELDFSLSIKDKHRFRVNVYYQKGSVAASFRLIPNVVPSLEDLWLPPIIRDFAMAPQGLVLVSGPTGHGKSTTQACMIDIINDNKRVHIVTIEDPIEFIHENRKSIVDQREVGDDTHSFAEALKHVLRQDPDVILVGEMRDLETVAAALTAAETGHLVIATLHTNDAVQSIDRLLDIFPPHQQNQVRTQLALSLRAIVSQRLLRRKDGKGLILATEILTNNAAVGHCIRDNKTHAIYSIMETHKKEGMHMMDHAIERLYVTGLISHETARSRMKNPNLLDGT
jgi:twitching motility protein PilT